MEPSTPQKQKRRLKVSRLIVAVILILMIAGLIGGSYYFFFVREKGGEKYSPINPEAKVKVENTADHVSSSQNLEVADHASSTPDLEENLEICSPAKGEINFEDMATVEWKVIGPSDDSCLIHGEIKEIKKLPPQLEKIPSFILKPLLTNLSAECLVPKEVYSQGMEKTGVYIQDNIFNVCDGELIDLIKKFGLEEQFTPMSEQSVPAP